MSIDYFVYLRQPEEINPRSFADYCASLGLGVTVHPAFNLLADSGYLPMRLMDNRFVRREENKDFLTGFEYYPSEFRYVPRPAQKTVGIFSKWFKAKPVEETPFDRAIKAATELIQLCCGCADSFEVLMAYVFGAYLVKYHGGVFDDPQTGQFYNNVSHMETEIAAITAELMELADKGELRARPFQGWT